MRIRKTMSTYTKPHLEFEEQLRLLKTRGLEVTDDAAALQYLRRLGYYRLSGYWYPCRQLISLLPNQIKPIRPQRKDEFMSGSRLQDAVQLYVFDKKLRLLMLDAIERVEVAFRVDIAHLLGKKDRFAHNNPSLLHGNFTKKVDRRTGRTQYDEWLIKHDQLIRRSKEDFVEHYKAKYGLPLPIWVAIELWDFGLLSVFYKGMTVQDKTVIAAKYGIPEFQVMESWLRCLNYVRNVVAHHSRLWNRNLIDQPKLSAKGVMPAFDPFIGNVHVTSRIYIVICILAHLMKRVCPRSTWQTRLVELIKSFPDAAHMKVKDMGFPEDWEEHVFWRI
jgi:abortive infection bacteriophage resistance protein